MATQDFESLVYGGLKYWRSSSTGHVLTSNRYIDILIAVGTGFVVSVVTHFVGKYYLDKKRKLLGKQFLPISHLKRNVDKVVGVFDFIVYFSQKNIPESGVVPLPSNKELVIRIRKWSLG